MGVNLYCEDWRVTPNQISFTFSNYARKDIIVKDITFTEMSSPPLQRCEMTSDEITVTKGKLGTVIATNCPVKNVDVGKNYRYAIEIIYQYFDGEEEHTSQRELFTTET